MISLNDVLLAMSNIPVDDPIAEIWGRQLQGEDKIIEYTGSLPITINANGDALLDYRIYGADGGVGVATESGEPAGYKLPMTVYKQEFKIVSDMLDQSNWVVAELHYFMYFDISDFISKEECDAKIYENFTEGYVPEKLVVTLTDRMDPTVSNANRILNNNGVILNKKFNFSSWNKIYLGIGYGEGFFSDMAKQLKIDELFGNWKILIAPTSQTQTVPVYIGENQLDSVEGVADYVDKASNKIARMIGEYTFTGDENVSRYGSRVHRILLVPAPLSTANIISTRCSHFTALRNMTVGNFTNAAEYTCIISSDSARFCVNYIGDLKVYFKEQYDNGTPVKVWYVLETPIEEDPPVPLPEIPTIDGTTVIDYDGDPKPSQMYIKYKGKG